MTSSAGGGEPSVRTYLGWQPERVNFLFGLSAQRAVMLAGAVLGVVWPLAASRIQAGVVTWPSAAALATLALVRVAGRTVDEWVVAFVSFQPPRPSGRCPVHTGQT
jgi:hypothetical protein